MTDLLDLTGKTALVTGASSGLGRHFAQVLARHGARVAVAARRTERLEALCAEIEGPGGRAMPVHLDVQLPDSVERAVAATETELGPISVLVNNAGIAASRPALETSFEEWNQVVSTNLSGAWLVAQATARHMARLGHGGSIVNIASILGLAGASQVPAYCAAKAGLVNLTRALAGELARHEIRVNALCPGYVATDLNRDFLESPAGESLKKRIPQRRFGLPQDLDGILLLLASDASRYMTGAVIAVDGGQSAVL
ncbi:NAD(P)-dependent dehydrogenase, short-chain alcohol dehydrogenase family [Tistlia consotensis]|uniref:NAD(P)-dependent dehydrogenase, short-chain alcohol dehydrogenase family n=1 Tax=Tistlia consotensis USBA 355 TaxID=560819 RepID=A0A1Y6BS61_9PROT|nr:glucose 1-dehydrogenase [Tistlia consotensis]SMF25226.1 NAD(P)-dependent dehydrogenase, short-chain alcohol dehydrogenase family [Tistlia consotensis USBA 355]SNR59759.1 NAD(P)-dependent dehydrogenase, short-chain alcohol dehydrogenase family [Tistlia consotensis]